MPIKSYEHLDQAYHEITLALGYALTQWQQIEHKLYQLFICLCGRCDQEAITVVFHEMSLETKLKAITELVRYRDNSFLPTWDTCSKAVFKQKSLRDKLAHWTVVGTKNKEGRYLTYLSPPITSLGAQKLHETIVANPGAGAIDADTLNARSIKDFGAAAHSVHLFMMSLPETWPHK